MADEVYDLVVVSNRLPVDHVVDRKGNASWQPSPGGLVTALQPVMRHADAAWVGWVGQADLEFEPFDADDVHLIPVALSGEEVERYYEGFSNDTLWPLFHDVIAPPRYHRPWWDSYVGVNQRFADAVAKAAAPNATVWVHDYQLLLVPKLLRDARPDLTIGFFNHIPFPPYGIFSQLPWRTQIIEGLLGADVLGFQRPADAGNFQRAVRRLLGFQTKNGEIRVPLDSRGRPPTGAAEDERSRESPADTAPVRIVTATAYPISIDSASYEALARQPDIQERARQIRADLGNPRIVILGVDRLDYTKGIGHRLKAYGELLADGELEVGDVVLVQVASPSRERVETYRLLRDEIELTVGRINGDYSSIGHQAVSYLHHGYPREEMAALYLAADIMLVTALRDGMNLVAKEYVATRHDDDGVLVLSEFAGASDELKHALLVNPHDIDGLKAAIMRAVEMPEVERRRRMRGMRKRVMANDVAKWSARFLSELADSKNR
jgi:trehalose 6-phosphate synthase